MNSFVRCFFLVCSTVAALSLGARCGEYKATCISVMLQYSYQSSYVLSTNDGVITGIQQIMDVKQSTNCAGNSLVKLRSVYAVPKLVPPPPNYDTYVTHNVTMQDLLIAAEDTGGLVSALISCTPPLQNGVEASIIKSKCTSPVFDLDPESLIGSEESFQFRYVEAKKAQVIVGTQTAQNITFMTSNGCSGCPEAGLWKASPVLGSSVSFCPSSQYGRRERLCIEGTDGSGTWGPITAGTCKPYEGFPERDEADESHFYAALNIETNPLIFTYDIYSEFCAQMVKRVETCKLPASAISFGSVDNVILNDDGSGHDPSHPIVMKFRVGGKKSEVKGCHGSFQSFVSYGTLLRHFLSQDRSWYYSSMSLDASDVEDSSALQKKNRNIVISIVVLVVVLMAVIVGVVFLLKHIQKRKRENPEEDFSVYSYDTGDEESEVD